MNLSEIKSVYICGFMGSGTVGLAEYFLQKGLSVTGSEYSKEQKNQLSEELAHLGMKQFWLQKGSNVPRDIELFIANEAIAPGTDGYLELEIAKKREIPTLRIRQVWAEIAKNKKSIVIAGTHGKSTTVAMIAKILIDAGLDPTTQIGASVPEFGGKFYRLGKSEWIILEGCEYARQFLHLKPTYLVLTDIGLDHLDTYQDQEDYNRAFTQLISQTACLTVLDRKLKNEKKIMEYLGETEKKSICTSMYLDKVKNLKLKVPGKHNISNASRAYSLCINIGIDEHVIRDSLESYSGISRRFEFRGLTQRCKIPVYDDYAHNPDKVKALLQAAKQTFPDKRTVIVFQPHQYHRTYSFLEEFGKSFHDADMVVLYKIYQPMRDGDKGKDLVTDIDLYREVVNNNPNKSVFYTDRESNLLCLLRKIQQKDDIVLMTGAGDIVNLTEKVLKV